MDPLDQLRRKRAEAKERQRVAIINVTRFNEAQVGMERRKRPSLDGTQLLDFQPLQAAKKRLDTVTRDLEAPKVIGSGNFGDRLDSLQFDFACLAVECHVLDHLVSSFTRLLEGTDDGKLLHGVGVELSETNAADRTYPWNLISSNQATLNVNGRKRSECLSSEEQSWGLLLPFSHPDIQNTQVMDLRRVLNSPVVTEALKFATSCGDSSTTEVRDVAEIRNEAGRHSEDLLNGLTSAKQRFAKVETDLRWAMQVRRRSVINDLTAQMYTDWKRIFPFLSGRTNEEVERMVDRYVAIADGEEVHRIDEEIRAASSPAEQLGFDPKFLEL
jgi:hypothetical protein